MWVVESVMIANVQSRGTMMNTDGLHCAAIRASVRMHQDYRQTNNLAHKEKTGCLQANFHF